MTDALLSCLRRIQQSNPDMLEHVIESLTNGKVPVGASRAVGWSISSQLTGELGRPDVEIRAEDLLLFIEVKDQAEVDTDQLRRYAAMLEQADAQYRHLILITRRVAPQLDVPFLDEPVRWPQVYHCLNDLVKDGAPLETT